MADWFLGEIRLFPYERIPEGWAVCDGTLLSIHQHQALYSLIGVSFGGNTTSFALPDLRGRTILGAGNMVGSGVVNTVGMSGGSETIRLTASQMPRHTHRVMATNTGGTTAVAQGNIIAAPTALSGQPSPPSLFAEDEGPDTCLNVATVGDCGGGGAHENRQPYLALVPCIAMIGVYPPRP